MLLWKNTTILDDYDHGLSFINNKNDAEIIVMGSKDVNIKQFPKLRAIFRAGIGKDNVPEEEAAARGIIVQYPSTKTANIIYDETASFTSSLILKTIYADVGQIDNWTRFPRTHIKDKKLLVLGLGNIGSRVKRLMEPFMEVLTYDILQNSYQDLPMLIKLPIV